MNTIYLIGEQGINAQGDLQHALALCDLARQCGCNCVKTQKRTPELCTPPDQWYNQKETPYGTMDYIAYRHRVEFTKPQYDTIARHCERTGISWTASVWDEPSVDFMVQYDPPFLKIPSAKLTDVGLLQKAVGTGIPVVVSTGMSTQMEIDTAVEYVPPVTGASIFHCHSEYPVRNETELNLNMIHTLSGYGLPVGYSSHSVSPYPAIYAAVLGAKAVEVHITLDRSNPYGDNPASLEKPGLELLRRELCRIPRILGDGVKRVYESELPARRKLRGE